MPSAVRYHVGAVAWLGESISFLIKSQVILTQTLFNKRLIGRKIALQWLSWTILILRLSRHLHAVCCHRNKLVWQYEAVFHPRDFSPTAGQTIKRPSMHFRSCGATQNLRMCRSPRYFTVTNATAGATRPNRPCVNFNALRSAFPQTHLILFTRSGWHLCGEKLCEAFCGCRGSCRPASH